MRSKKDDHRIYRFMGGIFLLFFIPVVLVSGLRALQAFQSGLLDSSQLVLVLIGVMGVAAGILMRWIIPVRKSRR
ncbi:hypothetical protein [Marinobacter halotolerans]|uniref:hypothetical protein n=1 Tax=Marinobacter halotolerans TaxID=1569211 RepID=UPI001246951B|nr:hypothetical protein [Marinobacter halotolerans]